MGKKRALEDSGGDANSSDDKKRPSSQILGISRSISACQRCRIKKVKCDQNFPKCSRCNKAGVECIGLDPATGREVPRSYVIHLEDRIAALEMKLKEQGVDPEKIESMEGMLRPSPGQVKPDLQEDSFDERFNRPISTDNQPVNLLSSQSTNQSISFSKLMTTAVKIQHRKSSTEDGGIEASSLNMSGSIDTSVSNKQIPMALLPPKKTAQEFVRIFFAQSNSQLPILHREEFLKNVFIPIYGKLDSNISLASNFTAINSSLFQDDDYYKDESLTWFYQYKRKFNEILTQFKLTNQHIDPIKISQDIIPPLKFHKPLYFLNMIFAIASSVNLLSYPLTISESFKLSAMKYVDQVYVSSDQLENLQGLLLLSVYSIMRPNLPGCWYIVGSALRLCVDLGLHNENQKLNVDPFVIDKRRRLLWCTYSIDRQICFYLSRPVGIPDNSITTPFPSDLDDGLIIPNDPNAQDYSSVSTNMSSYKSISIAFFKIREIQSEVQKILFENYEIPRKFEGLNDWRAHITKQLKNWKNQVPKTRRRMNCDFNLDFFQLNYHHTILVLHGLSPKNYKLSSSDYFKVSESSKELINIYANLLSNKMINYTWAAVLNLFLAGTSYLYTIYNSEPVRQQNSLFEVKKFTQDCINVMNSLVDKCDAASNCKNTFEMLTSAVIKLKYNETVHANFKIPSNYQIEKSQVVGPGNGNLKNLMEILEQQKSKFDDLNPFQQVFPTPQLLSRSQSPDHLSRSQPPQESFEPLDYEKTLISKYLTSDISQSPMTFEWAANDEEVHDDLNNFFNELENSPTTNSRRNSIGFNNHSVNSMNSNNQSTMESQGMSLNTANLNATAMKNSQTPNFFNNTFINVDGTPYSYDSNDSAGSSPIVLNSSNRVQEARNNQYNNHRRDGRKVYELIHQVPIDAIWDQFFTTPTAPGL